MSNIEIQEQPQWYIIHTHPGYELKVRQDLMQMIDNVGLHDQIFEINVPEEEDIVERAGKKKVVMRRKFPTYVFIKLIYSKETWFKVANLRGVTGFLGPGGRPLALTEAEIKRLRLEKFEQGDIELKIGDNVKIISGPLESFIGVVEGVDAEKKSCKVRVSMFGRDTPVELEFAQIDKL